MSNILEQPWTLLTVGIAVFIILWIVGTFVRLKPRWLPIAAAVLIAGAGFGIDYLFETDLEKIKGVITAGVNAAEEENADAIEPLISESYGDSVNRNKERVMRICRRRLSEPLIDKAIKTILSVDITGGEASAVFTVRIVFDKRSQAAEFVPIMLMKIKLEMEKESSGEWLIRLCKIEEINGQPASWRDINF